MMEPPTVVRELRAILGSLAAPPPAVLEEFRFVLGGLSSYQTTQHMSDLQNEPL